MSIKLLNQKELKKSFKNSHVNKKIFSLTKFSLHLNFSFFQKQRYEQKIILFSLHSSILFSAQTTPKFFSLSISCFKIHSNKSD